MRDYAKIAPQFWIGPTGKKIRNLGADAQVIAIYLLSSPHANMIGLYHLPAAYISADTGSPLEVAIKTLRSLSEAGFCGYDEDAEVVWVYEMARFQIGEQLKPGDKQCAGVQNGYDAVPVNRFLAGFYDKYAVTFHLKYKRGTTSPLQAPCKPLRSQEQEHEQEQDKSTSQPGARETFRMFATWKPSAHFPDLAKQAGHELTDAKLAEFIAHWLTQVHRRTQPEWDKALLQSIQHDKLRTQSNLPARNKPLENFAEKNYGTGIGSL